MAMHRSMAGDGFTEPTLLSVWLDEPVCDFLEGIHQGLSRRRQALFGGVCQENSTRWCAPDEREDTDIVAQIRQRQPRRE